MSDFLIGRFVAGRYRIDELISRDRSGDAYIATDSRLARRVILLTREIPQLARASEVLRTPSGVLSQVSQVWDPRLARIRDFGHESEFEFIVFGVDDGENLASRMRRSMLPQHDAESIVFQAAQGLAALHDARILHLFVDPTRIFLVDGDSHGVLLLPSPAWLGSYEDESIPSHGGTEPDLPGPTARYSSPERLRGNERLTPAADVFSLAVVGFEMLLGRYPEGVRDSEDVVRNAVRAWVRQRPVRSEFGEVLLHALRHDPAHRYQDASAFVNALRSMQVRPVDFGGAIPAPAAPAAEATVPRHSNVHWGRSDDPPPSPPAPNTAPIVLRPTPLPPSNPGAVYQVWYATNRRPRVKNGRLAGYGSRMDIAVGRGTCEVFVPRTHMIGSLGSSWLTRLISGSDDRLRLRSILELSDAEYWAEIRAQAQALSPDERDAVVFIHGYNVSFEAAALRTAQLGFDLNLPGPLAFFSWPSRAGLLGYLMDGAMVEASEGAIAEFLVAFAQNSGAERVHVIAHSMGNRGLLRAAQRIVAQAGSASGVRFNHLVLAAPDVTRKLFLELAANYHRLAGRTTLYISDRDRALGVSRFLQGDRVGYAPPVTTCPGVDSVYVSNVDRTFMGHSPFAESRPVLHDIRELIRHDTPPESRMGLRQISLSGDDKYWEMMR